MDKKYLPVDHHRSDFITPDMGKKYIKSRLDKKYLPVDHRQSDFITPDMDKKYLPVDHHRSDFITPDMGKKYLKNQTVYTVEPRLYNTQGTGRFCRATEYATFI
jgi:hypothetical protein